MKLHISLLLVSFALLQGCTVDPNIAPTVPSPTPVPTQIYTDAGTPFLNVGAVSGINAAHDGSWDEYSRVHEFTDGYQATGQAWGDYDGDGWADLFVTGNLVPSTLYRNNGNGTFDVSELSSQVSLPETVTGGAVWVDYDNDGWQDLFVLARGANVLFHNFAGVAFTDVTYAAGLGDTGKGAAATWGDYNQDSFLDLYVANGSCYPACDLVDLSQVQDRLFLNRGDGTFADVSHLLQTDKLLGAGTAASFFDYDKDGDPDIYVVNDIRHSPIGNVLWRNDSIGCKGWCWVEASEEAHADIELRGTGLAIGDYDNDQDLDIYLASMVDPGVLLDNQADGSFIDKTESSGLPSQKSNTVGWGSAFLDYDNDGWLDLYLNTTEFIKLRESADPIGMMYPYANALYHGDGEGRFHNATPSDWFSEPQPSIGVALADYDQDGWTDLAVGQWQRGYDLYLNQAKEYSGHNWLKVKLIGTGPINAGAVGARVIVTTDTGRTLMQEVISSTSVDSGPNSVLTFGLGSESADSITVIWPNREIQMFFGRLDNHLWQVTYGSVPALPGSE